MSAKQLVSPLNHLSTLSLTSAMTLFPVNFIFFFAETISFVTYEKILLHYLLFKSRYCMLLKYSALSFSQVLKVYLFSKITLIIQFYISLLNFNMYLYFLQFCQYHVSVIGKVLVTEKLLTEK